jgi:hypothetical protein
MPRKYFPLSGSTIGLLIRQLASRNCAHVSTDQVRIAAYRDIEASLPVPIPLTSVMAA